MRGKCTRAKTHLGERAVEDVNGSSPCIIGGEQFGLGLVDSQPGEECARNRRLNEGGLAGIPAEMVPFRLPKMK